VRRNADRDARRSRAGLVIGYCVAGLGGVVAGFEGPGEAVLALFLLAVAIFVATAKSRRA